MRKTKTAPKDRITELVVQKAAQSYLVQYYKLKRQPKKLYSALEERTKKKYGMKRADGLLAYAKSKRKAYVVSMEAKSHKTLPALKPYRMNKVWISDSIWKAFLGTLASGTIFLLWRANELGMQAFLLPLGIWSLLTFLHLLFTKNSAKYQEMAVVHQVKQYPANEQWLSFSEDALELIPQHLQKNLFKICKARGIGVLIVNKKKQCSMIHTPAIRNPFWKNFLIFYHNEAKINAFLGLK